MKSIVYLLFLAGLLVACEPANETADDAATTPESETPLSDAPAEEEQDRFRPIDSDEALIATALLAAPEESRAESKVIGYNSDGVLVTLKEGTNEFICLADDPNQEGFNAACYHKDLEPFMARGRELKAEGKNAAEIFDIREVEAKSGQLSMPTAGATLHIYAGPDARYDPETAEVDGAQYRYVVYLPFATAESTGLPEAPIAPNHPWIMNPGTHRAHIMITPLREGAEE